jgi:hypothetical protein
MITFYAITGLVTVFSDSLLANIDGQQLSGGTGLLLGVI